MEIYMENKKDLWFKLINTCLFLLQLFEGCFLKVSLESKNFFSKDYHFETKF